MSNSKVKKIPKPTAERYTLKNKVANLFLLAAFTVFPLIVNFSFSEQFPFFFEEGFVAIRHQKYYFFMVIAALAVIAEILLLATRSSAEQKNADPKRQTLLQSLTFTDLAVLAFVLCCAISTLFSPYLETALFGESADGGSHGRNNGMLLMLAYAAVYILLTRCFSFKEYVFTALAVVSGAVYLLAVLNGFYIDPLRMFVQFEGNEHIYMNFMTTIGNKNMFSSYICVTLPVIIALFVHTETLWRKIVYLASAALGAMAAVVCDSDSVVLGIGAFALVFLAAYSRRPAKLKKLLLSLTVMLLGVKLLSLFAQGADYKELGAVPSKIMFSPVTFAAIAVLAVLTAVFYLIDFKKPNVKLPKAVPFVLGGIFLLGIIAGIGVFVYFSAIDTQSDLGEAERLLRYGDAWGTHRGFMWNKGLEAFGKFNFFQKLFGTGPETFYYAFRPYFNELWERFGDSSTDAAHNEYINYLVNIGILGLAAYLAFTGGALVRAFKAAQRNPLAPVFAAPVVAYLAQAVVNIAVPIATPLFIIFVSLCEAAARQTKERESA